MKKKIKNQKKSLIYNKVNHIFYFSLAFQEKNNKGKADNFTDGIIDMNLSNLSKIEIKNSSINSSYKSISRNEEQKEMLDLLDNELNVNINFIIFL